MKLIMKEAMQFNAQHLRPREIAPAKIVLLKNIYFKRRTSQPSLQITNKGRTAKIPSSDHFSYCWREKCFTFYKKMKI